MESESAINRILEGLNPAQRAAVESYDAPSLIIAGAGSGKTRVLTTRMAYMILNGVPADSILAMTFTNKAATEIRTRIVDMVPGPRLKDQARRIWMGTFHSVFLRLLRVYADLLGYPKTFTIYDTSDSRSLIKSIVKELDLDDKKYTPARIAARISYAKNCLVTPGAYLAKATYAAEDRQAQIPEFGNIYNIYCERCKHNGAMDFDDLLLQTNILLRDHLDVLQRCQEQFRYILVDEYQDTNYAQYVIIRRLSQHHSRVCVVGDDAQSIYSFRGATVDNILTFQKDFPDAKVFKLEQNYRSTQTIVDAANSVIGHNAKRLEKKCFSEGAQGDKIRVLKSYSDREEAERVVSDLRDRVRAAGDEWAEAAILYRTNNQSLVFEENLRRRGIPYRIYKGASFFDHKEIKDLLAYIRLVVNPRDDEAFRRIVNYPARGIGDTTVQRIGQLAAERGVSMWEAVDMLVAQPPENAVQKAIARKAAEFVEMIRALAAGRAEKGIYDFGLDIASKSGILAIYRAENSPEATSALENIEELLNSMQLFKEQCDAEIRNGERAPEAVATVEEWLQQAMLQTDMDKDDPDDRNKVTLMTVHSAKGLEYKYVYIVGLEENLFPSSRASESPDGIEEERRLFYVALTRAKVAATLSYAEMRFKWGNMEFSRPSCFLREIDPQYLETVVDEDDDLMPRRTEGSRAIDELRRRFDYRFEQKQQGGGTRIGGTPADGESGAARRYPTRGNNPYGRSGMQGGAPRPQAPDPALVQPLRTSTEGMRRLGTRPASAVPTPGSASAAPASSASSTTSASAGDYAIGQRVEHPKFGRGTIVRIETLATDHKLVIAFDAAGEKTLIARFAKLTEL